MAKAAAAGATNRQIADSQFLEKTVEFHLSAIYRRLELTRADLEALRMDLESTK